MEFLLHDRVVVHAHVDVALDDARGLVFQELRLVLVDAWQTASGQHRVCCHLCIGGHLGHVVPFVVYRVGRYHFARTKPRSLLGGASDVR